MIQRSPAERYFKYLIAHPSCYDNRYIEGVAKTLSLDYLGESYLQAVRGRIRPPVPFLPEDRQHRASQRFLTKELLDKAFNPDADMTLALKILQTPRLRELVETMVISGAPDAAITMALKARYHKRYTESSVRYFKHYFWDISHLDTTQVRTLLELRFNGALRNATGPEAAQYAVANKLRHTDPRVVASRMPVSPLTALLAQMQLGILPKDVDLAKVVETTRMAATLRTMEATLQGGPAGVQMAQGFAIVADVMTRLMDSVVRPDEQLRKDLQKITVATTPGKLPLLAKLSGGHHTVSLQPEPKTEEKKENAPA